MEPSTPPTWLSVWCHLCGLVVTRHNSSGLFAACSRCGEKKGMHVFPPMKQRRRLFLVAS
jgi:hypothetical protein